MTKTRRIGVVEVGSRAVRLLVADVSVDAGIHAVASDWRETQLASAVVSDPGSIPSKIDLISTVTQAFLKRCHTLRAEETCVVGTEAVRNLGAINLAYATTHVSGLIVLSRMAEARCSLIAGAKGFDDLSGGGRAMVIDQGAGSMELAIGEASASDLQLIYSGSYPLGTHVLVEALRRHPDLQSYCKELSNQVAAFAWPESRVISSCGVPIILGSAATKIAWMNVRTASDTRYDARRVHGQIVDIKTIDWLVQAASASPATVMSLIEPEPDPERILVGLAGLAIVLRKLEIKTFRVSGLGMRYGVAWMLGVLGRERLESV